MNTSSKAGSPRFDNAADVFRKLSLLLRGKPLVLLRFDPSIADALHTSKHGLSRFTIAKPHESFNGLRLPTLCLVELATHSGKEHYVGVVTSNEPVSTVDSRITVIKLQPLNLTSLTSLKARLASRQHKTALKKRLDTGRLCLQLAPQLSGAVIDALAKDQQNSESIRRAALSLPKLRQKSAPEWAQGDAVRTALAAFGVSKTAMPRLVEVEDGGDSTLSNLDVHALEDNVINKDASEIPGYTLLKRYVTGRAVFENNNERLDVYTANKGPLEEMLGVDLIYVNEVVGNTVMVQYKMLEPQGVPTTTDWIFRPDSQFNLEVSRMKLPRLRGRIDDYRLHRDPFFFKFVKRKGDGDTHQSFIVSLDHLKSHLSSAAAKGAKGGIRVSYQALDGAYLRGEDLIGLIRSGYIGTHRIESAALRPLIEAVAKGDRALVFAWQRRIKQRP